MSPRVKIAVASGKGGTGKTFVSTNLFKTIENSGHNVTLIDCDVDVPDSYIFTKGKLVDEWPVRNFLPKIDEDKCTYCGKCAEFCNFNAITCIPEMKYISISEDICHSCKACTYACEYDAISPKWKDVGKVSHYLTESGSDVFEGKIKINDLSTVAVIREAIRHALDFDKEISAEQSESESKVDFMILDSPPGCSCPFVNTVMSADYVILVAEPTPFGISDLKKTMTVLDEMSKRYSVIINRSNLGDANLKELLETKGVDVLMEIPYSEEIARTYSSGKLIIESSDNQYKMAFENLLDELLETFLKNSIENISKKII